MSLPAQYLWLKNEPAPKILLQALALYGTVEAPGFENNQIILGWSNEVGPRLGIKYAEDAIPWCGLFVSVCAVRSGYDVPNISVRAKEWIKWGNPVALAMLGDVIVFEREGGGHVGFYVGEDNEGFFHILGGNQADAVNIRRFNRNRVIGIRRSPWKVGQPPNVRRVFLSPTGEISHNEA